MLFYLRRVLRWVLGLVRKLGGWAFDVFIVQPLRGFGRSIERTVRRFAPYVLGCAAVWYLARTGQLQVLLHEVLVRIQPLATPVIAIAIVWYGIRVTTRKAFGFGKKRGK